MIEYRNVINNFSLNLIEKMKKTCHSLICDGSNKYHREDTIFNHTYLVLNECNKFNKNLDILKTISLFHDTGKIYTEKIEFRNGKARINFNGHWFYSSNIWRDFIYSNENLYKEITKEEAFYIYKIIALHYLHQLRKKLQENIYKDFNQFWLEIFNNFKECDVYGRISDDPIEPIKISNYLENINTFYTKNNLFDNFENTLNETINIIKKIKNKENKNLFLMTIGQIASEKSFLIKKLIERNAINKYYIKDYYRMKLYYQNVLEKSWKDKYFWNADIEIYKETYEYIQDNEININEIIKREMKIDKKNLGNIDIVLEGLNMTFKSRRQYLSGFGQNYTKIGIFFFSQNFENIKENNKNRLISLSENALKNSYFNINVPLLAEGFDYIIVL